MVISLLLSVFFFLIGSIHFYWAFGGEFGLSASLPTNEHGERVLNPKKTECIIVGLGLSIFGLFYLLTSSLFQINLTYWIFKFAGWIIPSIFLLRAIGDFKYAGFFKKIKSTEFGKLDTYYFSPICLVIAVMGFLLNFLS